MHVNQFHKVADSTPDLWDLVLVVRKDSVDDEFEWFVATWQGGGWHINEENMWSIHAPHLDDVHHCIAFKVLPNDRWVHFEEIGLEWD